jgi:hypothetical protein
MSRDPEEGKPINPGTLHKYLYANGDPIDGVDPTGHADLFEVDASLARILKAAPTLKEWGIELVDCTLAVANDINSIISGENSGVQEASTAEVAVVCGRFLFDSFRVIFSLAP